MFQSLALFFFAWFRSLRGVGLQQVSDLSQEDPLEVLHRFRNVPNLRLLACGGDGTVAWLLQVRAIASEQSIDHSATAVRPPTSNRDRSFDVACSVWRRVCYPPLPNSHSLRIPLPQYRDQHPYPPISPSPTPSLHPRPPPPAPPATPSPTSTPRHTPPFTPDPPRPPLTYFTPIPVLPP